MGDSYIKQGTFVICTNMTSGKREIGVPDNTPRSVLYHGDPNKPILHEWDNKISDTFVCKNPIKKFGGLVSMLAGMVIGAVVVAAVCAATVVTGGTALVVMAAIVVTAAVGSGAAIYSKCHDCDETLNAQWQNYHKQVTIEGGNHPILKRSTLKCPCQGVIFLMINPVLADKAASYIRKQNRKEIGIQLGSQFLEGLVGGLTGGCTPWGLAIGAGLYCWSEEENPPLEKRTTLGDTVTERVKGDVANGSIIKDGIENTSNAIDAVRSGSSAAAYSQEAAGHVAEAYRLNSVVDDAAIAAAEAEARQRAVGRTASTPGRGQWQARREYQSVKEAAEEAAETLTDARSARNAARVAASEATENAHEAFMASQFAKNKLARNIAKGIGSFLITVAMEYGANRCEEDTRDDTVENTKKMSESEGETIGIIANNK